MAGRGPLVGYKILDLTQFESGTVCTETLAWLGADVWKVERPEKGELGRYSVEEAGVTTIGFTIMNMNKKSITCNLKSPEGLDLMKKLLKEVDVIVENMSPGAIDRLGLGYEVCKKINPGIIFAQIKGFAMNGPYKDYPAFNPVASAMGGIPACTGLPGQMPTQPGLSIADSGAGYMCALSIVSALLQREREGKREGQRIEVAMHDVMVGFQRANWEPYYREGKPVKRVGNGMPLEDVAPAGMYPCKPFGPNDYVHIYCSRHPGSNQFDNLCKTIGREDLLTDERMATPRSRYQYRDILDPIIAEWTGQYSKQEAMDILCKAGIPTGAVLDCDDITKDISLRENGTMVEIETGAHGKLVVPGFAPKLSANEIEYQTSPELGENNLEIYEEVLGLSEAEIAELQAKKII